MTRPINYLIEVLGFEDEKCCVSGELCRFQSGELYWGSSECLFQVVEFTPGTSGNSGSPPGPVGPRAAGTKLSPENQQRAESPSCVPLAVLSHRPLRWLATASLLG